MVDNSAFIKSVNVLLAESGVDRMTFYKEVNITSASFAQWNKNICAPRYKKVAEIAAYFSRLLGRNITADELLTESKKPALDGIDKEAYDLFAAMSPEKQALALAKLREIAKI